MVRVGGLELDLLARSLRRGAEQIELTNREFALLELLAQSSPRTVSKSAIVERVWDQHFDGGTNVVNVYINYLRSKIDLPGQPSLIRTVRGIGFALVPAGPNETPALAAHFVVRPELARGRGRPGRFGALAPGL